MMAHKILQFFIHLPALIIAVPAFSQTTFEDIKPFDPVNMESRIGLDLDSYYFVAENRVYALKPGYFFSIPNKRHLMGLGVPVVHSIFSDDFAGFENTTGIGDFKFTYIGVPFLSKDALGLQRISTYLEVTAPTGNERLGRGTGAWVYKPGIVLTYRPDVAFYFFPQVNFQFSATRLNSLGGGDGVPDLQNPDKDDKLKVVSFSVPA